MKQTFSKTWQRMVRLVAGGDTVMTTNNHPFYLPSLGRYLPADSLRRGMKLLALAGTLLTVQSVATVDTVMEVFNFGVATHHNYYVGREGWLAHNDNTCIFNVLGLRGDTWDVIEEVGLDLAQKQALEEALQAGNQELRQFFGEGSPIPPSPEQLVLLRNRVRAWEVMYSAGRHEFTTDVSKLRSISNILGDSRLVEQGFTNIELKNIAESIGVTKQNNLALAEYLDDNVFVEIERFGTEILSAANTIFDESRTSLLIGSLKNSGIDGASQKGALFTLKNANSTPEDFIGNANSFEYFVDVSPSSGQSGKIDLVSFIPIGQIGFGKMIEFKSGVFSVDYGKFKREFLYRDLWNIPHFEGVSGNIFQWRLEDVDPVQFKTSVRGWLRRMSVDEVIMEPNKSGQPFLEMFADHYYSYYGSPPYPFGTPGDFIHILDNDNEWFTVWFDEIFTFY